MLTGFSFPIQSVRREGSEKTQSVSPPQWWVDKDRACAAGWPNTSRNGKTVTKLELGSSLSLSELQGKLMKMTVKHNYF